MKTLRIDEKWSVSYDPDNNDRPETVFRNGEAFGPWGVMMSNNVSLAMWYRLLELETESEVNG